MFLRFTIVLTGNGIEFSVTFRYTINSDLSISCITLSNTVEESIISIPISHVNHPAVRENYLLFITFHIWEKASCQKIGITSDVINVLLVVLEKIFSSKKKRPQLSISSNLTDQISDSHCSVL